MIRALAAFIGVSVFGVIEAWHAAVEEWRHCPRCLGAGAELDDDHLKQCERCCGSGGRR